jgi:hypothetical protein
MTPLSHNSDRQFLLDFKIHRLSGVNYVVLNDTLGTYRCWPS